MDDTAKTRGMLDDEIVQLQQRLRELDAITSQALQAALQHALRNVRSPERHPLEWPAHR